MIEISNLVKKYGDHMAVDHLSLTVEPGKIYGLLGPNGAGKSTTMNIVTGYIGADGGTVKINGYDIFAQPEEAKKCIGYLPEIPPLYVDMMVYEYLKFVAELKKLDRKKRKEMIADAMDMTGITEVKNRLIKNLSKGYRQRVGFAQALLGYPEIIILDEPTVGLDPKQIIEIRELIKKLGENHTVILSSHILSEISAVCDHVFIISKGKLVASDATENLINLMSKNQEINLVLKSDEIGARGMLEKIVNVDKVTFEKSEEEKTVKALVIAKANCDIREEIFELASAMHMPILEMHTVVKSLEDVFLELTGEGDEKKTKTDQLMLTSPVSVGRIVAGKYLAMAAVYAIDIALFALSPLVLSIYGKVALSEAYVALFGHWLYGLSCIAVGLFISSISESVIISAILTFAALFLSYMMQSITGLISSSGNLLTKVLNCFDLYTPFENFVSGCFSVTSAAYYVTVILLLCFLTTQSIQKRRWAFSKKMIGTGAFSAGMIVIMCAICVVVNLVVTALPTRYTSIDCSATKLYSLTSDTKDRISKLDEDITIYVLNSRKSKDAKIDEIINRYKDLSSHIKVKYVDPATSPKFYQDYTDTTPTTNSLIIESKNRSKVIDYNDIYEYDSSSYYYGYQSQSSITGFDAEGQITSAIEYVTMDADELPVIYQITGHNETEIGSNFQSVVSKANANLKSLELFNEEKVPEDATAIIINSPTFDFNEEDAQKVIDYLNDGGKALIVGCYAYNDELTNFNKILAAYKVSFKTGVVAENDSSKYYQNPLYLLPTVETTDYTSDATDGYVFLAGSCAINYPEDTDDVTYTKLLSTSDSAVLKKDWKNITTSKAEDTDENGPFTTGFAVNDSSTGASIVVFGTPYVVDDSYDNAVSGNNADMFKDVITSMTGNVELASSVIPVKDYTLSNITINTLQAVITGLIIMIAVPILLIIIGIVVWAMRRKK